MRTLKEVQPSRIGSVNSLRGPATARRNANTLKVPATPGGNVNFLRGPASPGGIVNSLRGPATPLWQREIFERFGHPAWAV